MHYSTDSFVPSGLESFIAALFYFSHYELLWLCFKCRVGLSPLHYITCHLADVFIQSNLQLIRLNRRHTPLEQCGVKGLAQGPNSCTDLIVATPGLEPPT